MSDDDELVGDITESPQGDGSFVTLDNAPHTPDRNEGNQGNLESSFTPHSGFTDSPHTDKADSTPRNTKRKTMRTNGSDTDNTDNDGNLLGCSSYDQDPMAAPQMSQQDQLEESLLLRCSQSCL